MYNHADLGGILAHAGEPRDRQRRASARTWYEIRNAQRGGEGPTYAEIYLYDEIGMWGVSAGDFLAQLNELDVDEIDLHVNSPGGDLFDGVAIYQALVNHRATVYAFVDALAASIASVITMAGDRVTMAPMSRMFIHDAWGVCVGNASDMRTMGERLDDFSSMIAGAYASRAGGTTAQWRKKMQAESWFSPEQAVAEGLADEVSKPPAKEQEDEGAAARYAPAAARRRHDPESFPWLRPAAESEGGEPAPASPPAPTTDPQPVDEPGDDEPEGPSLAEVDLAGLLAGDLEPDPEGPALEDGLLAAVLEGEWKNAPAAPVTPAPPPAAPAEDFGQAISSALQEAFQR